MNTRKNNSRSGSKSAGTKKTGTSKPKSPFAKTSSADGKPTRSKTSKPRTADSRTTAGKAASEKTSTKSGAAAPGAKKEISARDKGKYVDYKIKLKKGDPMPKFNDDAIRLNKYLSNAGVCSRREADMLIETGVISINGVVVTEMGYKVKPDDVVKYDEQTINAETKRYVLLNKPKGFITTMDDPMGRKTVMSLVKKACRERVYPVGRLDRDTTGLLLFTNDGDMAKKLTHPQYKATKIYHVELNKKVSLEDLERTTKGILLEDGKTAFDKAEFVRDGNSKEVGVELHSGKNRIVRRMFEHMGYEVVKLDRVKLSGLTKKDLPRGMYRHLTEKEVSFLKMS